MKNILTLIGLLPTRAAAANIEQLGSGSPGIDSMWAQIKALFPHTNVGAGGVQYLALKFIDLFLRVIGGIAVAVLIYGGIRMILSRGNDEGLTEAKKVVTYTLFGLVLVIVTDALINYVIFLISAAAQ